MVWFPCEPEMRRHLDALPRKSVYICTSSEGRPWKSEKIMQGAVSDCLTTLNNEGVVRKACTLHGLRVTYASGYRRIGVDTSDIPDLLGDRSPQMGVHYTRHVEKEVGRLRAWQLRNGG